MWRLIKCKKIIETLLVSSLLFVVVFVYFGLFVSLISLYMLKTPFFTEIKKVPIHEKKLTDILDQRLLS